MLIAIAVLVGLALVAFAVDYGTGRIVKEVQKIVLLLARDVNERSEDRLTRLDHDLSDTH